MSSASKSSRVVEPAEEHRWKTELPSWSGSTPIVWDDRIFLMSPSPAQNAGGAGTGGPEIIILCLSRKDGSERWRRKLDEGNELWRKHNNTSPSPVTDGAHVWAVTGNGVVACLNMDGKVIWTRDIQRDYGEFGLNFGYASSPILYDGRLILQVLHGSYTDDPSYIVALDAGSGKEVWREERATDAVQGVSGFVHDSRAVEALRRKDSDSSLRAGIA